MRLPESFTTVTPLSRRIALVLFFMLPISAFYFGRAYQKALISTVSDSPANTTPRPTSLILTTRAPKLATYTNKTYRFAFDYPDTWIVQAADDNYVDFTIPPQDYPIPNDIQIRMSVNPHSAEIEEIFTLTRRQKTGQDVVLYSKKIGGYPAIEYLSPMKENGQQIGCVRNVAVKMDQTTINFSNFGNLIPLEQCNSEYSPSNALFDDAISTLSFY